MIATEGYLSKRVAQVYERADQLEREVSDADERARVLRGIWTYKQVAGQLSTAAQTAADLDQLGARENNRTMLCEANRIAAQTALFQGRHADADQYLKKALDCSNGNKNKASELLGISFRSLRYRLDKLGIET